MCSASNQYSRKGSARKAKGASLRFKELWILVGVSLGLESLCSFGTWTFLT
jgi:hypothetical protein